MASFWKAAVRWFGSDGKRYSKSFKTRKEAERLAEAKQFEIRNGKAEPPAKISLRAYYKEHKELMQDNVAPTILHMHLTSIGLLTELVGWNRELNKIPVKDIEKFRSRRLKTGIAPSLANRQIKGARNTFRIKDLQKYGETRTHDLSIQRS